MPDQVTMRLMLVVRYELHGISFLYLQFLEQMIVEVQEDVNNFKAVHTVPVTLVAFSAQ